MQPERIGPKKCKMVKLKYVDWDTIVQTAEANLEIIAANKRKAEIGEMMERLVLSRAKIERRKYPEPAKVKMEDTEKPEETPESPEEPEKKE